MKSLKINVLLVLALFTGLYLLNPAFAQEVEEASSGNLLGMLITANLSGLLEKFPIITKIVFYIGLFRSALKPTMVWIEKMVLITPSTKDDALFAKVKDSKIYKTIVFLVDYLMSVKLPK